ncbi:unnamed protein product [Blepharisma stoltei]|uniref:Uncharacterized protein n=1 Tax=Blepharisma stoltei TaxID=1481888 RepID=A0AAU9IEY2_9CILI|nr:unnamed protein product [Blepharisma stoltei]
MEDSSPSYSVSASRSQSQPLQTPSLEIQNSQDFFGLTPSPPNKNIELISNYSSSVYETLPILPLPTVTYLPPQSKMVFDRLIEDVNKRNHLKIKVKKFLLCREEEEIKSFRSPKRLTKGQVEDLYNRLLADQQKRQESQRLRQMMKECFIKESPKSVISKQKEEELLARLSGYAKKKKEWLEIMQEKKRELEDEEFERLQGFFQKKCRDPDLFERLSVPKSKPSSRSLSATRLNFVSPPRSPTVKAKKICLVSKKPIDKCISSARTQDTLDVSNSKSSSCESTVPLCVDAKPATPFSPKQAGLSHPCTPNPESTMRTWCTARVSLVSEDNKTESPKGKFTFLNVDDYLNNLKAKIKSEIAQAKNQSCLPREISPSLWKIFKLFPELEKKMKILPR